MRSVPRGRSRSSPSCSGNRDLRGLQAHGRHPSQAWWHALARRRRQRHHRSAMRRREQPLRRLPGTTHRRTIVNLANETCTRSGGAGTAASRAWRWAGVARRHRGPGLAGRSRAGQTPGGASVPTLCSFPAAREAREPSARSGGPVSPAQRGSTRAHQPAERSVADGPRPVRRHDGGLLPRRGGHRRQPRGVHH